MFNNQLLNFTATEFKYVPDQAVEAYKSTEKWTEYEIRPLSEYSSVSVINDDKSGIERYDMNGKEVNANYKGVVVIINAKGESYKTLDK